MTQPSLNTPSRSLRAAPWLLIALIVAAYAPTWDAEFVVWDDDDHIYENRHILAEDGYWEAWKDWRDPAFYPITFTSWYVEWRVADGDPWLFHVNNVVLHATNAILLGLLLRALGLGYGLAWTIAGVWALHPQQAASVAWLTERKNLLYALFYLAAMLAYASSVTREAGAATRGWILSLVLALAALLSKATAVTLPIAIALTHWVRGAKFDRRALVRIGAFFALSIVVGLVHVSREEVTPLLPFSTRMLVAARAAWFYVGKFLWPTELVAVYPRWALESAPIWGGVSFAALGAAAAIGLWQARQIPEIAWLGVGMYAANIALVIGVVWFPFMGYSFVSDHLLYVAAAGLALVFGLVANALLTAVRAGDAVRVTIGGALWLFLAFLTWQQTGLWENTEALWTRTLALNPESRLAHKNLGVFLMESGRPDEAHAHFEATLALEPNDVEALLNMGVLASDRGDWNTAIRYYTRTIERGAYLAMAFNNLGIAATRTGKIDAAIGFYEQSLEHDSGDPRTWMNLGAARAAAGDLDGAIEDYETALRMNPRGAKAHYNLAVALYTRNQPEAAAEHYEHVLAVEPADVDALYNLGVIRMDLRQTAEAIARFREVLAVDATHPEAAHNLGVVLLNSGDSVAAEEAFTRAYTLAPGDPDTARMLAMIRQRRDDAGGAIAVLEEALARDREQPLLANQLAWLRATSADPQWRNPQEAIAWAKIGVLGGGGHPSYLDTLAAALAAAGRFSDAEAMTRAAIARTPERTPAAVERERRRALYAMEKPFAAQ
ncbi:MAG: tetratricopeptide repeat protein [Candidatus Binatia bacterium]|nr:tetratricopeptide repeat protein [Candidatus Binatia bacterium]